MTVIEDKLKELDSERKELAQFQVNGIFLAL